MDKSQVKQGFFIGLGLLIALAIWGLATGLLGHVTGVAKRG
jgi:hypothetical protein